MRRIVFIWLLAGMTCLASAALTLAGDREQAIREDRQRIQGTWRIVEMVVSGNVSQEADARKLLVVNGDDGSWILFSEGREISKGSSTLDPTQTPKAIDFTLTEGNGADKVYLGIYELGETTRRMCFAAEGMPRPANFISMPGTGQTCLTFEREMPQPRSGE